MIEAKQHEKITVNIQVINHQLKRKKQEIQWFQSLNICQRNRQN